jgi:thiol-disulfide isomerase/thioredoxin
MITKTAFSFLILMLWLELFPSFQATGQVPLRTVLIEEFTGEWCGWCPIGMMELEEMIAKFGDSIIVVAVHTGDQLESESASEMIAVWANFAPSALINRIYDTILGTQVFDTDNWEEVIARQIDSPSPCEVQLVYGFNAATRMLTAEVTAVFTEDFIGDGRLNLYIVEDSVVGDAQHNYLSGDPQFIGTPFYALPDPIPGFIHEHVLREMLGESYGIDGIIPDTVTAGQIFSYTFTYTIPAAYNLDHLHLIGVIQQHKGLKKYRKNLNSIHIMFDKTITGQGSPDALSRLSVWPNPANEQVSIRSTGNEEIESVILYSLNGAPLSSGHFSDQSKNLPLQQIPPQACILVIRTQTGVYHHKLIITR